MKLSLVVPCYNEEECIEKFYKAASDVFSSEKYTVEYIFIDDGSNDKTLKLLKKIYTQNNNHINIISFSRNFGKEAAMYAGLKAAKGDYICYIDADLQQRPELVAKMVSLLEKYPEYDCIGTYAKSRDEKSEKLGKAKHQFYKTISKMSGLNFVDGASDFRCFRRNMADSILQLSEYHRFTKGLFAWIGFNTKYLPYEMRQREAGESKWGLKKLFNYAFDGIIAFSSLPLKIPFYVGGFFSAFGIIYLLFYLIFTLAGHQTTSPLAIITALMFIFTGFILIALGVIGEYIGKIHIQVKNRPIYITRETYLSSEKSKNIPKLKQQEEYEIQRAEQLREKKEKLMAAKKKENLQKMEEEIKPNADDFANLDDKKINRKNKKKKNQTAAQSENNNDDDKNKINNETNPLKSEPKTDSSLPAGANIFSDDDFDDIAKEYKKKKDEKS